MVYNMTMVKNLIFGPKRVKRESKGSQRGRSKGIKGGSGGPKMFESSNFGFHSQYTSDGI